MPNTGMHFRVLCMALSYHIFNLSIDSETGLAMQPNDSMDHTGLGKVINNQGDRPGIKMILIFEKNGPTFVWGKLIQDNVLYLDQEPAA